MVYSIGGGGVKWIKSENGVFVTLTLVVYAVYSLANQDLLPPQKGCDLKKISFGFELIFFLKYGY